MTTPALRLGHVNIRATSLEATVRWYETVLGLRCAPSATNPNTSLNLWLHDADGRPCVHVNQRAAEDRRAMKGAIDHVAFDVDDRAAMEAHLDALGITYEMVSFPAAQLVQLNLRDPDGIKVELTCRERD